MHVLHLHGQHLDTGLVAVQDLLEQHRGVALDLQLAVGDGRIDEAVADDLAHGGLGGVTHQVGGVADVEQVLDRVADLVLHAELDVDDVLVAGEHGGFLGHAAQLALTEGGGLPGGAEAHLAAQHLGHLGLVDGLDGSGQRVMGAGAFGAVVLAEAQHHALLVRVDDIDARQEPQAHQAQHQPDHHAARHLHAGKLFQGIPAVEAVTVAPVAGRRTPGAPGLLVLSVVIIITEERTGGALPLLPLPFFLQFIPIPSHVEDIPFAEWG